MDTKIAVVGCGIWGKNLVRNFYNLGVLHSVCDLSSDNIKAIINEYSEVNFTNDFNSILNNQDIKGVAIATPSHTHYKLVKQLLEAGKNVYVEKPIATRSDEAKELNDLSERKGKVLMVGHLLMYHPVVNRLRDIIAEGTLGKIGYVQSDRLNVNPYRNDRSVMWDLAPHDVSMISYVIGKSPQKIISATGFSTDNSGIMDITHLDIEFEGNIHGHISNSWITPVKRVQLLVRGTKATAILDDTEPQNKLQIFENYSQNKVVVEYPDYLEIEPLKLECQHFINAIVNKMKPRSDGNNGYEVVKILEEADKVMLGSQYEQLNNIQFASSRKETLRTN